MQPVEIHVPNNRIRSWDWILIIGLTLAPMTGLRIWKVGPAELLTLIWCLRYFPRRIIPNGIVLRFFFVFLIAMAAGTVFGYFVAPEELHMSDWATWLYLAFTALGMYQGLRNNSLAYNEALLRRFATVAILTQLLLYLLANLGVSSILDAPLWYYYRYSGGGTNPHQVAVMMCGLIFVFARELQKKRRPLWNLLLMIGCTMILFATKSSTGVLSFALSAVLELMVLINGTLKSRRYRIFFIVLELLVGALILLLLYQVIYRFAYSWIANDSNGLGRLEIFSNIQNTIMKSPLFGLGPGEHSMSGGKMIEYHNSYLEIIAASGLVGFIALAVFTVRLLVRVKYEPAFLPVVAAMYAYGFAGFSIRRLVYWGIMVFVIVICEQRLAQSNTQTEEGASSPERGAGSRTAGPGLRVTR